MKFITALALFYSLNTFAQQNSDAAKEGLYYIYVVNSASISSTAVSMAGAIVNTTPARGCLLIGEMSGAVKNIEALRQFQYLSKIEISNDLTSEKLAILSRAVVMANNHCYLGKVTSNSVRQHLQRIKDIVVPNN
jgi:hypothetical protein